MASGDTHTGIDYWMNIPAKDLSLWLSLMEAQARERKKAIERAMNRK